MYSQSASTARFLFARSSKALVGVSLLFATGCAATNGIVEVEGCFCREEGGKTVYSIHVGQDAIVRFRPKQGGGDYAVCHDDLTGSFSDADIARAGWFEFPVSFDAATPTGHPRSLSLRVFGVRGIRDHMVVKGTLHESPGDIDLEDTVEASFKLWMEVFQSRVELVVRPGAPPDWDLSELRLNDGVRDRVIRYSRFPRPHHFSATPASEAGAWLVTYEPAPDELNLQGDTNVTLRVQCSDGHSMEFQDVVRIRS